jgi:DNA recombination-dependent growth factor C
MNLTTLLAPTALNEEALAELLAAQFDAHWFPNYHRFSIDTEDAVVYVDFDDAYSARLPEDERQHVAKALGFLPATALHVQANPVHPGSAQLAQRVADVLAQQFRVPALAR